jgi:hypothetical protein
VALSTDITAGASGDPRFGPLPHHNSLGIERLSLVRRPPTVRYAVSGKPASGVIRNVVSVTEGKRTIVISIIPRSAVEIIGSGKTVLAYLDGSADTHRGKVAQQFVTLASIAAYQESWDADFAVSWGELVRLNGGEAIHANELHQNGSIALLERAVQAVSALRRPSFHAFGCVVNLADYVKATQLCPALSSPPHDDRPKPPEAVCVDWCVGHLFDRLEIDWDKKAPTDIGLVFDQSEKFLHWIYRVRTAPYSIRPWWARKRVGNEWERPWIGTIASADSESHQELQAADVIAWVINRRHTHGDRDGWYSEITSGREEDFKYYDFKRLLVKYAPDRATIDDNVPDPA